MAAGFIDLDASQMAYVILAVRRLDDFYRRNGMAPPEGIRELLAALTRSVSGGHAGSFDAGEARTVEVETVRPLLVSYSDAAAMLAISVSTLKRRLADGELTPVFVGGLARLRVADIETYVSALTTRPAKDSDGTDH